MDDSVFEAFASLGITVLEANKALAKMVGRDVVITPDELLLDIQDAPYGIPISDTEYCDIEVIYETPDS